MAQYIIDIDRKIFHFMSTIVPQWGLVRQSSFSACRPPEPWWRSTLQMNPSLLSAQPLVLHIPIILTTPEKLLRFGYLHRAVYRDQHYLRTLRTYLLSGACHSLPCALDFQVSA
jgi:hypothetical protein